jgi:CHAD domain-containing protein
MQTQKLDSILRHQYEKCLERSKTLRQSFDIEAIHEFRVETKRLRTLLRLVAAAPHSHIKPKLPRNLKVFYTLTGILRNLQLQQKALEDAAARLHQGLPANCIALLNDRIAFTQHTILIYLTSTDPLGRPRPEWYNPISTRTINAARESFIIQKTKAAAFLPADRMPDEEQLHTIRKAMKDLLYAWPYLSRTTIQQSLALGLPDRKNLRIVTGLLGDLLDCNVCLSLLQDKTFLLFTCPSSAKFLEEAGKLWSADKQAILGKIKEMSQMPVNKENPLSPVNLSTASYELHVD